MVLVHRNLEAELRDALHAQLETVLDAAHEATGDRVIDNLLADAEQGRVISVSVHSLPKPAETAPPPAYTPAPALIPGESEHDVVL